MKVVYDEINLNNLRVLQHSKQWLNSSLITYNQMLGVQEAFKCNFFNPNIFVRIVLFVASLLALSGVTVLMSIPFIDNEKLYMLVSIIFSITSLILLEKFFIKKMHHYKSGVNEAILYYALSFFLFGITGLFDFMVIPSLIVCIVVFLLASIRYLDLLSTLASILSAAFLLFYVMFEIGTWVKNLIPFGFILFFVTVYFVSKKARFKSELSVWGNNLLISESLSLLFIYFGGNYLVVRELSIEIMDMVLLEGEDIPLAFVFYSLTILIPAFYIFWGIKKRDIVLLRIGVVALFFSVFTFKYYFSLGHPEITLTLSGLLLIGIAIYFLNYLKLYRSGFTREKLIAEKWASINAEAFVISQTMGGNVKPESPDSIEFGRGGNFDGGGAGNKF